MILYNGTKDFKKLFFMDKIRQINIVSKINDNTFAIENKGETLFLSINPKGSPEFQRNLAEKAAKILRETKEPFLSRKFRLGNQKWRISQKGHPRFLTILARIFDFFHKKGHSEIKSYEVTSAWFGPLHKKKVASTQRAFLRKAFKNAKERANYRIFLKETHQVASAKTAEKYKNLVRAELPLGTQEVKFNKDSFFKDPFTILATQAFQIYEKDFTSKDFFAPEFCDYRIIANSNKLQLVHKTSPLVSVSSSQAAITAYKTFLANHFDKEKINYIEHLYRFKLDTIDTLTPEHIYRINVGLTNLEKQDLDGLLNKLKIIAKDLSSLTDEDLDQPIKKYLEKANFLTGQEAKGIYRLMDKDGFKGLKKWLEVLDPDNRLLKDVSPKELNDLIKIQGFSSKERDRALTGRQIFGFIRSGYSTAGLSEYKPWIDQHQLTQFFSELINARTIESLYEKYAHVVSKVHHTKEHPTEGYRVGQLIPAPPLKKGGEIRWYKITACISNGYGNFNFIMENVCNDPSLPGITLFRSTSHCPYSLHARASVVNDLNLFNSPGELGKSRTHNYESKYYKKHTIPVSMGYMILAQRQLKENPKALIDIAANLKKANQSLLSYKIKPFEHKTFVDILRLHDAVLNDLFYQSESLRGLFWSKQGSAFARFLKQLVQIYLIDPIQKAVQLHLTKSEKELSDAKALSKRLKSFLKHENSPIIRNGIKSLLQDINDHILTNRHLTKKNAELKKFHIEIFDELEQQRLKTEEQLKRGELVLAEHQMQAWVESLNKHFIMQGEDLNTKVFCGKRFIGHSLGGASAAVTYAGTTADQGRIPLPETSFNGYFFDDPGTNRKTNQDFIAFGNEHHKLLKALKIENGIFRRQEAGDIISTAGEEHFGAADSLEKEKRLSRWMWMNAAVNRKKRHAKHFDLILPKIAHETRFLSGSRRQTFYSRKDLLVMEKEWESKTGSPHQKAALLKIRSLMNSQDYITTHYGSHLQSIFDHQGRPLKDGDPSHESTFLELNRRIWRVPSFLKPQDAELKRKSVSFFFSLLRLILTKTRENYVLEKRFLDKDGNFVVTEEGVLTRS